MEVMNLRLNHISAPLGYDTSILSLSWCTSSSTDGAAPMTTCIEVTGKGCNYNSGILSDVDSRGFKLPLTLSPRTHYTCNVTVKTDSGETAVGSTWFETGKMDEPWNAKWISSPLEKNVPPIFERRFALDRIPQKARLYLCGLGVHEVLLNGHKVGREYLAPGYHDFHAHVQVNTYDVTENLKVGENVIEIWLGNGWFKGRMGFHGGLPEMYGNQFYALGELWADDAQVLITDENWSVKQSPILMAEIYDGEIYDARLEQDEVFHPCVLKEPQGIGPLVDRISLPIVEQERLPVKQLLHTPNGETVLDFGQNLTGWVEFENTLPSGSSITLRAAEILQDGNFYRENLREAKAEFTYTSNGIPRTVRPHFTFYGFRYMQVICDEPVDADQFTAVHLRSDFAQTGFITTGNAKVNQLFSNVLWGQKDNFLDVPTDCPQRDERLGWTGDAQVFSATACYNMDSAAFFRKYMWDMWPAQQQHGGAVPNVIPQFNEGMLAESGACPWSDAAAIIPWNLYLFYGDKNLLAEQYHNITAWVEYQYRRESALGGKHLIKDGFHFADWLALDNPNPGPLGATDPLFIASAYYYRCAQIAANAAEVLEKVEDAARYQRLADEILRDIQAAYYDENGLCTIRTQTALALTICFGLGVRTVEEDAALLAQLIQENDGKLNTGFVGTPLLCPALAAGGQSETALSLLLNEDYPGWLYCVNLGATTIWERWNSVLPDGHMNSEGMNSLNHYAYGSIMEWMYGDVCGLRPVKEAPGFAQALVQPHPCRELGDVECRLETASGTYRSGWRFEKDGCHYYLSIPYGASARLKLPDQRETLLAAGNYEYVLNS